MSKFIVQLQNDLENVNNKIISRIEKIFDSENFNTEIVEIEDDLNLKEDEVLDFVFDEAFQKVVARATKKTKSGEEKLKKEIEVLKGSIIELTKAVMEGE